MRPVIATLAWARKLGLRPMKRPARDHAPAQVGVEAAIAPGDVVAHDAYLGGGYGLLGEPKREAIQLVARQEGILLDPVYPGRAMACLLDLVQRGEFGARETILFWHTGGTPALFAYADELLPSP